MEVVGVASRCVGRGLIPLLSGLARPGVGGWEKTENRDAKSTHSFRLRVHPSMTALLATCSPTVKVLYITTSLHYYIITSIITSLHHQSTKAEGVYTSSWILVRRRASKYADQLRRGPMISVSGFAVSHYEHLQL